MLCDPTTPGTKLDCDKQGITGPIPGAIVVALPNLKEIDLSENELTGTIPAALAELALTTLDLDNNKLTGTLDVLASLPLLEDVDVGGNQMEGTVPAALGDLAQVTCLSLYGNKFAGPLPPSLAKLGNLRDVFLNANALSGTVPAWLGALPRLRSFQAANNKFSGTIPPELGKATALESLWLNTNDLSGCVPLIKLCGPSLEDEHACDITSGDTNEKIEGRCAVDYMAFLRDHDLHEYHDALKAEGAHAFEDLLLLTDEDIFALRGMQRVHARKLLNAIAPHRPRKVGLGGAGGGGHQQRSCRFTPLS